MRIYLSLLLFMIMGSIANAQSLKIDNNQLVLPEPVTFKTGTSVLTDQGRKALEMVKKYLQEKTYISLLRIEGHVAGEADEQVLSEGRAMAVAKWLIGAGIDCKRLIIVGFGSTKPITEKGSENTRIVFATAALRGHLIGGMPASGGGNVAIEACN